MPYFLTNDNLRTGKSIQISGEEARHILLSHRVKIGEQIKLQGPDEKRFLCEVVSADKKSLVVKVLSSSVVPNEPSVQITLFQSIVSEKALDFIFQKSTELGAVKIILFNSANTATKLSADLFKKKKGRWDKILMEAAKQSERSKWPSLEFALDVNQAIEKAEALDKVYLTDITGSKINSIDKNLKSFGLIVGPEGGFTRQEIQSFESIPGLGIISLANYVLRAETASIAGISILQFQI